MEETFSEEQYKGHHRWITSQDDIVDLQQLIVTL